LRRLVGAEIMLPIAPGRECQESVARAFVRLAVVDVGKLDEVLRVPDAVG